MDGENNGEPYEQMDDLGGKNTPIFGLTPKWGHHNSTVQKRKLYVQEALQGGPQTVYIHGVMTLSTPTSGL